MASPMDSNLLDAPNQSNRSSVATEFWGKYDNSRLSNFNIDLMPFWKHYSRACRQALHDGGRHNAVRSHADVIGVVRMLKSGMVREEIRSALRSKLTRNHDNECELLDNAIDLAASLLLMCDFGATSLSFSGRTELRWIQGTLQTFMADYFSEPPILSHEGMKLEKTFLARNMSEQRYRGILRIRYKSPLLTNLCQSSESLLPDGLAEETLQTLALLCPSTDRETRRWLPRIPSIDQCLAHCGRLKTELRQIERFHFWRDRLVMLKQAYDEAQPKTLTQWWHDRRNGVQWYTFWVAVLVLVLTILFGLIQSVEGALQVYASFKALDG
ncbi:hypothetical protein PG984_013483 [Apiospora sp. TS-2023a]